MPTLSRRMMLAALAGFALCLVVGRPAGAQIKDPTDTFSPQAKQKAEAAMEQIKQKYKTEFLVEVFPEAPADVTNAPSGQRAAPGAIERVEIDAATKEPRFKVIGSDLWSNDPGFEEAVKATGVTGICGSGIIEAVAEMRMAGLLDAGGLIGSAEQTGTSRLEPQGRTHAYLLHDGTNHGGPRISVTQGDIRAIQRLERPFLHAWRLAFDHPSEGRRMEFTAPLPDDLLSVLEDLRHH